MTCFSSTFSFFSLHFLEISWQLASFPLHYCHPQGLSCHHFFISLWFFFESKAQSLSPPRLWVKDLKAKSLGPTNGEVAEGSFRKSLQTSSLHLCMNFAYNPQHWHIKTGEPENIRRKYMHGRCKHEKVHHVDILRCLNLILRKKKLP